MMLIRCIGVLAREGRDCRGFVATDTGFGDPPTPGIHVETGILGGAGGSLRGKEKYREKDE